MTGKRRHRASETGKTGKVWFCRGAKEWGGFPRWLSGIEFTCSARDVGLILGWRMFPGGGNANPL